jgi:hypothetical protein
VHFGARRCGHFEYNAGFLKLAQAGSTPAASTKLHLGRAASDRSSEPSDVAFAFRACRSVFPLTARARPRQTTVPLMIRASTRRLSFLAAVLLAAACGSSGGTSGGSTPTPARAPHIASVDACTLVTADEASAAVGSPLTNLSATGGVQIPGACIYGASGSSSTVFVYAQVYPDATAAGAVQPDKVAAALAGQLGVSNAHSVNGIGDRAVEYSASGTAGGGLAIFVFRYNVVMLIAVDPTSNSNTIEQLARRAVSRLVTA